MPPSVTTDAPTERSPLILHDGVSIAASDRSDDKVALALRNPDDYASPATELKELLQLAYPVVLTTALEFLPGFTSTIQAGHLQSPFTKEYVDAATLSTMVTC
jgi:Na+-driven multidrug efflux pump